MQLMNTKQEILPFRYPYWKYTLYMRWIEEKGANRHRAVNRLNVEIIYIYFDSYYLKFIRDSVRMPDAKR